MISPKLFTLALEDVFGRLTWDQRGISVDGKRLSHLRFADDIVFFSSDADELATMLRELKGVFRAVGLRMNLQKTKIMSPTNILTIDNHTFEMVEEYVAQHQARKR